MTSKAASPAANLLRNSRLMAMPTPIPVPKSTNIFSSGPPPFPTRQAIATPRASAHRGEWGLKRDLPLRVSRKTHYVRYDDLDTIDHMTTFESAHDDVYTLKKWQEMGLALHRDTSLTDATSFSSPSSLMPVFDSETKPETYKWRYKGPNLKELSADELEEYISKISKRSDEFYDFVARKQAVAKLQNEYTAIGQPYTEEQLIKEVNSREVKPEVDTRELRSTPISLERYTVEFLDLPHHADPPVTHPSAGLYYVRSNAHCHNDPEQGPQEVRKSVPGRDFGMSSTVGVTAGIAGVVATVQQRSYESRRPDRMAVNQFIPLKAKISTSGRIMLDADRVLDEAKIEASGRMMRFSGNNGGAWRNWGSGGGEGTGRRLTINKFKKTWDDVAQKGDGKHAAENLVQLLRNSTKK
ncbi:hypothetical protein EX30DRAFT_302894 [Ascodesmis nigricans]|uniref:Uncharacterized protein n=1 Tax=Ascodesmis nigricans TaxID=341454 RepID=A0A4S2N456_9PEZI|nr:hypothetical protein EX30DRAFT_302894 [Ascodesmis nigricans]